MVIAYQVVSDENFTRTSHFEESSACLDEDKGFVDCGEIFRDCLGESFIGEGFVKAQVLFDVEEGEGEVRLVPLAVEVVLFDLLFEEVHPYQR